MKFHISVLLFSLVLQASAQIWLSKVAEFLKETDKSKFFSKNMFLQENLLERIAVHRMKGVVF